MQHLPESKQLPWTRFWSPRKTRDHGATDEFFEDPQELFGKHLHPFAATLPKITPETGLLVLCGEPGLGKSYELELLRGDLAASEEAQDYIISLETRIFESFTDLQSHLVGIPSWQAWLTEGKPITILLDGLDEGLIRIPTLVSRLKAFLESKPVNRLRLILTCRSFEWPVLEGDQLASLWPDRGESGFAFELEPLRRKDALTAAERRGYDGEKFLEAVHRANLASLASRPITLLFLLDEFHGAEFENMSRRHLYKNGCRRLCEEHNQGRATILRTRQGEISSTDEKFTAAGILACGLLLGGGSSFHTLSSYEFTEPESTVLRAKDLIDCGLISEATVQQVLGTGLFAGKGPNGFGFAHQTFAEFLAAQTLADLPLPHLTSLLCAKDFATGDEYVIPQLVELAAWVAGDHPAFFDHLLNVDPPSLLRSGVLFARPDQKAALVERVLELADKNRFFDELDYWRFWKDLDHPELPSQLQRTLEAPISGLMVRRIAVEIAKACRRAEMVPTLFALLKSGEGEQYFRSSVAEALCECMPDDRLGDLEPLLHGEVGPDPDQSIFGEAMQHLVPRHCSVSDVLPLIGRTANPSFFGSYWRALKELPNHLADEDILNGLRSIQHWEGGFSSASYRRDLCMGILHRALYLIDDPEICDELVKLWKSKSRSYQEFFRTGDKDDSDFSRIDDVVRRKWISAILNSFESDADERHFNLTYGSFQLIKADDFGWLLETLLSVPNESSHAWAKVICQLIQDEAIRVKWWDDFLDVYHRSPALHERMRWLEETSIDSPSRRKAKADWLREKRRQEQYRRKFQRPDPRSKIDESIAKIVEGNSWAFRNLCLALSLDKNGFNHNPLRHDLTQYPQWENLSEEETKFVAESARRFLLERSDGWEELGAETNYSAPGVAAIWLLRDEVTTNRDLKEAIGTKWIAAALSVFDSSSDHAKELFALAYGINPSKTIIRWISQIRRDCERHGHPFAMRRAGGCFDGVLLGELIDLIKVLNDPLSVRRSIEELRGLDQQVAGNIAAYLLRHELARRRTRLRMVGELIVAGLGAESRQVWSLAYRLLNSRVDFSKEIFLAAASDDFREANICRVLNEDEIGDLYILLCRLFPPSQDPADESGWVTRRQAAAHFRGAVLNALSARGTTAACRELKRIAAALPDQATWILYRYEKTLSTVRRDEWNPCPLPLLAEILSNPKKRILRDNADLMNLILESLVDLQSHLTGTDLPAVEDLWQWEGAGLRRSKFHHKDEESVSDYIARWLRDRIGPESKVVVNREVQPERGKRTDILVQAWSHVARFGHPDEGPLSVTVEVKGCWNSEIRTGAERQLLAQYLRPFQRTHGIFLVAWFYSPGSRKTRNDHASVLAFENPEDAFQALSKYVEPAQVAGFEVTPLILDCRLRN